MVVTLCKGRACEHVSSRLTTRDSQTRVVRLPAIIRRVRTRHGSTAAQNRPQRKKSVQYNAIIMSRPEKGAPGGHTKNKSSIARRELPFSNPPTSAARLTHHHHLNNTPPFSWRCWPASRYFVNSLQLHDLGLLRKDRSMQTPVTL